MQRAIALDPNDSEAAVSLSEAHALLGDDVQAADILEQALAHDPGNPRLLASLKELQTALVSIEQAEAAYQTSPDSADVAFELGQAQLEFWERYQDQRRLERAIERFTEAVTRRPEFARAYIRLGRARVWQGRNEEAARAFAQAVAIAPDERVSAEAYSFLAERHLAEGRLDEAVHARQRRDELRGGLFGTVDLTSDQYNWEIAYREHGSRDIDRQKLAIAEDSNQPEPYYRLALAYGTALGLYPDPSDLVLARDAFREAIGGRIEDRPVDVQVQIYRGLSVLDPGSGTWMRRALRLVPQDAGLHAELAEVYLVAAREYPDSAFHWLETALSEYEEAIRLRPDRAEAHLHLGEVAMVLAEDERAIRHLKESQRLGAADAVERLVMLDQWIQDPSQRPHIVKAGAWQGPAESDR
ncbi:MAG: tetratricopeptide repeat protein [Candidatus Omnitrophica bacterium]|nr:tetratricopeptide repeat protein [Candidatus Omnitrophota bacterium]